jgi:serine O-acetyltransferase
MDMDFWKYAKSDLYRYCGKEDTRTLIIYLIKNRGFKYSFWMRCVSCIKTPFINHFMRYMLKHYSEKYLIEIPAKTQIGRGLCIPHAMGIAISSRAVIGTNCNISQFVTIGKKNRGKYAGYPTIGNSVYIGAGAKIIGGIHVGNNAAIGANCVVTKDVPDNAVVVGIPGKIISYEGSAGYINSTID